jgi:hypothetical protein
MPDTAEWRGRTGLIWWQWRAKNPIMNLRLFKYKSFATCCLLMILVGGVLNAATVLEPQFLQQLMGYTATRPASASPARRMPLLNSDLKRQQIKLTQGTFVDLTVATHAIRLLFIARKVFD